MLHMHANRVLSHEPEAAQITELWIGKGHIYRSIGQTILGLVGVAVAPSVTKQQLVTQEDIGDGGQQTPDRDDCACQANLSAQER